MNIIILCDFLIESVPSSQYIFLFVIISLMLNINKLKKKIIGLENIIYNDFGNNMSIEIKRKIDKLSDSAEIPLRILNNYFNIYEKRSFIID